MKVKLLHSSPLWLASNAIRMSHDNHHLSDTIHYGKDNEPVKEIDNFYSYSIIGEKDIELIHRVGNKLKHKSVLEQLVYWFEIDGISRSCLQELARHRTARLIVKSTRYTLNELKNEEPFMSSEPDDDFKPMVLYSKYANVKRASKYIVLTKDRNVNLVNTETLERLRASIALNTSNDIAKYMLPEAYKTKLQWQIDGRNLQNFLELRTSKDAHWEIRELAYKLYDNLPEEYKYLYLGSLQ